MQDLNAIGDVIAAFSYSKGGDDDMIFVTRAVAIHADPDRAHDPATQMCEQAKAIGQGASTTDPRWAVPAIAEAWCYATISLSEGYLERVHAEAIIGAIEAFTSSHS